MSFAISLSTGDVHQPPQSLASIFLPILRTKAKIAQCMSLLSLQGCSILTTNPRCSLMLPEQLVDGSFSLQQVRSRGGVSAPTENLLAIATFTECSTMRTSPVSLTRVLIDAYFLFYVLSYHIMFSHLELRYLLCIYIRPSNFLLSSLCHTASVSSILYNALTISSFQFCGSWDPIILIEFHFEA